MDQLKSLIATTKKHHFWILTGLASIIGVAIFFISGSRLQKAYADRKNEITGAVKGLDPLVNGQAHPNSGWVDTIHQTADKVRRQVLDSWTRLYQDQAAKVYVWPAELQADFAEAFNKPLGAANSDKMQELRERYMTYVTNIALPQLAKIIDAEWVGHGEKDPGAERGPMRPGGIRPGGNTARRGPAYRLLGTLRSTATVRGV